VKDASSEFVQMKAEMSELKAEMKAKSTRRQLAIWNSLPMGAPCVLLARGMAEVNITTNGVVLLRRPERGAKLGLVAN
jgi:hypothetical protein